MSAESDALERLALGSVRDAREALGRRTVSSRELVEVLLRRIDAIDPSVNAIVELCAEEAIEEAKGADRAIAAGHAGALLGVPTTIKEAFNVAGLHTTWGNPAFEDYVADWDATVVSRLRKVGAVGLSFPMFRARLEMS
jgi:amidase